MELAEQVGRLYLQGRNETQIANQLGIQRKYVVAALRDFRGLLKRESETAVDVRERLLDIIYESDESFRMIIDEAWTTVRDTDAEGDNKTKVQALKLVESSTKSRAEMLQKSGVSQDNDIIDEMNEKDRRQEVLVGILREVKQRFPEAAEFIAKELSRLSSTVETVAVEREELTAGE